MSTKSTDAGRKYSLRSVEIYTTCEDAELLTSILKQAFPTILFADISRADRGRIIRNIDTLADPNVDTDILAHFEGKNWQPLWGNAIFSHFGPDDFNPPLPRLLINLRLLDDESYWTRTSPKMNKPVKCLEKGSFGSGHFVDDPEGKKIVNKAYRLLRKHFSNEIETVDLQTGEIYYEGKTVMMWYGPGVAELCAKDDRLFLETAISEPDGLFKGTRPRRNIPD